MSYFLCDVIFPFILFATPSFDFRLHYPIDVIAQCFSWFLTDSLSLHDIEEIIR